MPIVPRMLVHAANADDRSLIAVSQVVTVLELLERRYPQRFINLALPLS